MVDKSKFDRKTPSSSFLRFIGFWALWSVLIGIVTSAVFAGELSQLTSGSIEISTLITTGAGLIIGTVALLVLGAWQKKTIQAKTGREIKRWSLWSAGGWLVGIVVALIVTTPIVSQSGRNTLAVVGTVGLGLAIIYGIYGGVQSVLLSKHVEYTWMYGLVMFAGVLFWGFFVGDPRKIALGGLFAPALQGMFSGMALMWLFHLSRLGNIAIKNKNEPVQEAT